MLEHDYISLFRNKQLCISLRNILFIIYVRIALFSYVDPISSLDQARVKFATRQAQSIPSEANSAV